MLQPTHHKVTNLKKLLLVEDDSRLAELIQVFLSHYGFSVTTEANGDNVIAQVDAIKPDIVLLDIMLPGTNGFTLCQKLRPQFSNPILFLTAKNSNIDQVKGLDLGADDYIIKPIDPSVLLARINALLRRVPSGDRHKTDRDAQPAETDPHQLTFGQLQLDRREREVSLNQQVIELTSHEFELLWLLAVQAGTPLSRELIHNTLLGRDYDGMDRSVDVRISRLRKKLHDDPKNPFRIKTVWGKGYLFVPGAWHSPANSIKLNRGCN